MIDITTTYLGLADEVSDCCVGVSAVRVAGKHTASGRRRGRRGRAAFAF